MNDYSELGKKTYGSKCEFDNCGWDIGSCDVHHINYIEQWDFEQKLRELFKETKLLEFNKLLKVASSRGFLNFNTISLQLSKDDSSKNLCVLCPNHHREIHHKNLGMDILNYLPTRR